MSVLIGSCAACQHMAAQLRFGCPEFESYLVDLSKSRPSLPPFTFCQISTVLSRKKKSWYLLWIKYSYFAFFLILHFIIFIQLAIAFFVNMVHSQLPCSILSKYWQPFRSSYICQNFVINIYCEFLHWDENGNASRWLFLCFANFSVCNAECPGWILNILGNVLIHQGIPCLQIISYSTCFRK